MDGTHYDQIYEGESTHWWYRVRRLMVHDLLARYFPERHDLHILDVGCGMGLLLTELRAYGKVEGVDVSPKSIEFCRQRGIQNVQVSAAETLPFANSSFDVVLALDVIEHVPDDSAVLREIHRVLKPGGVVVIFVPAFMFLWGITDVLSQHYRRYTRPQLVAVAHAQKFSVVRTSYFNTFLFPLIATIRIVVRLLHMKVQSENEMGSPLINRILFKIFYLESRLLRFVSFPFGISVMLIGRK